MIQWHRHVYQSIVTKAKISKGNQYSNTDNTCMTSNHTKSIIPGPTHQACVNAEGSCKRAVALEQVPGLGMLGDAMGFETTGS